VSEELDRLWALHEFDEEIAQRAVRLAAFPDQRAALDRAVTDEQKRLDATNAELAAFQKQRRELEREIEAIGTQEKKFLAQQAAVKTNAEFQALTHEIEGSKAKRSDLETRVLMLMDDEERVTSGRKEIEHAVAAAKADRDRRAATIGADEAGVRRECDVFAARRDKAMESLTPQTRSRYERIHTSRAGRAVVAIVKGACGGCFRALPPQTLAEARKRDLLLVCEGCGRLVVMAPEPATGEAAS
jgi:predicted  nucleic acid-binding Zn-ribbon protein